MNRQLEGFQSTLPRRFSARLGPIPTFTGSQYPPSRRASAQSTSGLRAISLRDRDPENNPPESVHQIVVRPGRNGITVVRLTWVLIESSSTGGRFQPGLADRSIGNAVFRLKAHEFNVTLNAGCIGAPVHDADRSVDFNQNVFALVVLKLNEKLS
ncbi:MAG: hypothetical protein U0V70_21735 [Terriglobia bacterium]